jgi:hypothetical protein
MLLLQLSALHLSAFVPLRELMEPSWSFRFGCGFTVDTENMERERFTVIIRRARF